MKSNRRSFFRLFAVMPSVYLSTEATAETVPRLTGPLRIIVPYAAGGGSDFFARTIAQPLGEVLGRIVIVENRPGASGMIAMSELIRLPSDGNTLLLGDVTTYSVNPHLFEKVTYDVERDLVPITKTGTFDFILAVNPAVLPVKNVDQLITAIKNSPNGMNYGATGIGATHHLLMELFAQETHTNLVAIQYKGGAPATQDLLAGVFGVMFVDRATAKPHIESGKLRPLATASIKRLESLPEVPTLTELGLKEVSVEGWQGFTMKAGTPAGVVEQVSNAYAKAVSNPEIRKKLIESGINPVSSSSTEFAAQIKSEASRWNSLIKKRGIKAN